MFRRIFGLIDWLGGLFSLLIDSLTTNRVPGFIQGNMIFYRYIFIRSPRYILSWLMITPHSKMGVVHFLDVSMTTKYRGLNRESSVGKGLLVLVTVRIFRFRFSIALVVYMILLISGGYLKNTDRACQLSLQLLIAYVYLPPHVSSKHSRRQDPLPHWAQYISVMSLQNFLRSR